MKNLKKIILFLLVVFMIPAVSQAQMGAPGESTQINNQSNFRGDSLQGLTVQIVYTSNRYNDAMNISRVLRNYGVNVKFNRTSSSGNQKYTGKILYKGGFHSAARRIANLVRGYEYVSPQLGNPRFYHDKQFNLWVTSNKGVIGGLRNLRVNIVYTSDRYSDALSVGAMLRRKGMMIKYTNTSQGASYRGKVLYKAGYYSQAKEIASLIRRYEFVVPQQGQQVSSYRDKQFNLWITSPKYGYSRLRNLKVNIVYTQDRYSDALSVGSTLRRQGMIIKYTKTTAGASYRGKVLYKAGYYSQAKEIARLVRSYETVMPQQGQPQFYRDKQFNLWITSPKYSSYSRLRNLRVNIVYTRDRYSDALSIGSMLRRKGMSIKYTKTTMGDSYRGKVLYKAGYYSQAREIASLVRRYEYVVPQQGRQVNSYRDKQFNLWITSYKRPRQSFVSLNNLIVNIVYTDRRYNSAMDVGELLRRKGMRVKYTETSNGRSYMGKILYRDGYAGTARHISNLIRRYEYVVPQRGTQNAYRDKHFNLWITR